MEGLTLSYLGDPNKDDVTRGDVYRALDIAQNVVARNLLTVDREMFRKDATITWGANPTESLPADFLDPLRVEYEGLGCRRMATAEIDALTENPAYRALKGYQQFYTMLIGTAGRSQVKIYPQPANGETVVVSYVARPTRIHESGSQESTITTSTSASSITDSNIAQGANAGFWDGATVRITAGATKNEIVRVTAHTATGVFALFPALSASPGTVGYEIDQTSIIPDVFHDLMPLYAAGILAPKLKMDGRVFIEQYRNEIQLLNSRWVQNVNQPVPGELDHA